ncbi:MAG: RloB domain-containing protein, partial [Bacteroidales bacterium]|nr:RloB domain-containing protein [Bacteroidales bacterium]
CIFDLDKCLETEDFFQAYKNVLLPLSKNEYIIFCASMPSIEYWFLTHYAEIDNDKFYKTASSVIKVLEKFDSELSKIKKAKTFWSTDYSKNWVKDILCEDEHLNRAISHAKAKSNHPKRLDIVSDRKDCDVSYSDMYKLFEIR